jgi:predicted ATPase
MHDLPRGTVTLLFTDIEGSTRLLHELGDAYAEALADHRRVLRDAFGRHGGVEVDTQGDAFFYAFRRAADAIAAAADAQAALAEGPVRVRIGVHTGEPLVTDEGYVGVDVHRAARIMSAGHGGQVLVSETTRRLVDARFTLRDLGPQRLKDMTEPHHLFQLGEGDFPPLKTLNQTNLPIAASPLLGREAELAQLVELVLNGGRVVTVTGAGGSGKTRLALQAAADVTDRFADGVFWIPLAGIGDPELVLPAVAQALGVKGDLATQLGSRQILLLLDNFEHVITAAPRVGDLLAAAPEVRVLVTSRSPLRIGGEREYALDPLSEDAAVTLFVERARSVGATVAADTTVAQICRRLDRLPLALELAAARTKLLTPVTLLERLERSLPLLTGGRRDAPERQRTLRATIEWSFDLLDENAKRLFERLSVFAGSFSLDAAEHVAQADLEALAALVDLNLLKPIGDDRFLMLETIREYALEGFARSSEVERVRMSHAEWFAAIARAAEPQLTSGAKQVAWVDRLETEIANLRVALGIFEAAEANERLLALTADLWRFWWIRGHVSEGRRWLERALAASTNGGAARARALEGAYYLAYIHGDVETAYSYVRQLQSYATEISDSWGQAGALLGLGLLAIMEGDVPRARQCFVESLVHSRPRHPIQAYYATVNLAHVAWLEGDYVQAEAAASEAVDLARRNGDRHSLSHALALIAFVALRRDLVERANEPLMESLRLAVELHDEQQIAHVCLPGFAAALAASGDARRAAVLLAVAARERARYGIPLRRGFVREIDETASQRVQEQLTPTELEEARRHAESLSLDETIEYVLTAID